jgi:hypothetical protein
VEEEPCRGYSQLSWHSPCCSAQAKRPVRSGQSRSSIAVRAPSFRRKHRSGRCPVGPAVPATGNRLSAPKRLFLISARDALPEWWISTGCGSSHLPSGALGNDLGKSPHQRLAARLRAAQRPLCRAADGMDRYDDPLATVELSFPTLLAAVRTPSGRDFPMSCRRPRSRARASSLSRAGK